MVNLRVFVIVSRGLCLCFGIWQYIPVHCPALLSRTTVPSPPKFYRLSRHDQTANLAKYTSSTPKKKKNAANIENKNCNEKL
jgi:hypothetical protein